MISPNQRLVSKNNPLLVLLIIIGLWTLADALIAYISPIIISETVKNTFLFGIIISLSSVAGLIFDVIAGEKYENKGFKFFTYLTFVVSILFPIVLLISRPNILTLVISMVIWGIYYESLHFMRFNFIDQYIQKENFTKVWGLITVIISIVYFVGPLIAAASISFGYNLNLIIVLLLFILGYLVFVIAKTKNVFKKKEKPQPQRPKRHSFISEIKIWHIFYKRLNLFWLLTVVIFGVDAFMWTIGIVYSQLLAQSDPVGRLFVPLYVFPSILFSIFTYKLTDRFGKKRITFLNAIVTGLLFLAMSIVSKMSTLLILTFMIGVSLAIIFPAVRATYEDYIGRLGAFKNDLIGFEQAATSIAYIIFPIVFGLVAEYYGFKISMVVLGTLLLFVTTLTVFFLPKKIKMPQKELVENTDKVLAD